MPHQQTKILSRSSIMLGRQCCRAKTPVIRASIRSVILGAALLSLAACGGQGGANKAKSEAVTVEVRPALGESGGSQIIGTGAFQREREIELSFRIPGVLKQVNFREGDLISQGAIVATIDPTQVEAQIVQAQAQAIQASAGIGQAVDQARAANSSIAAAQAGQVQAVAASSQAVANLGRSEAGLAQAQADLDNARRDFQRDQALAAKGFVADARLDARKTRLDVAQATVRAAEAGVNAARQSAVAARAGINAASAGVVQAQAGAGAAQSGVQAASGRAQAARAGVSAAAFDRRWANLIAPASGVVLNRTAEPGEIAAAGKPILVLADEKSALILRVPLSDRDVARVRVGDSAIVKVSAVSRDLQAQVRRVAERADPRTGAFDVDLSIFGSDQIKTGFIGEARILATGVNLAPTNQVLVPPEALIEAQAGKGALFVLAPDGKTVKRVAVGFLGFKDGMAIVQGLAVGAKVVTAGGAYVSDGASVAVVEAQ